jgi:hypothetical protein
MKKGRCAGDAAEVGEVEEAAYEADACLSPGTPKASTTACRNIVRRPRRPSAVKRPTVCTAAIALLCLVLGACGENSPQGVAASPTILNTTDPETVPMGKGQECIDRLTKIVDSDYLAEHDLTVPNDDFTRSAIASAISTVCKKGPPDQTAHEGAHEVVHAVEHELAGG